MATCALGHRSVLSLLIGYISFDCQYLALKRAIASALLLQIMAFLLCMCVYGDWKGFLSCVCLQAMSRQAAVLTSDRVAPGYVREMGRRSEQQPDVCIGGSAEDAESAFSTPDTSPLAHQSTAYPYQSRSSTNTTHRVSNRAVAMDADRLIGEPTGHADNIRCLLAAGCKPDACMLRRAITAGIMSWTKGDSE